MNAHGRDGMLRQRQRHKPVTDSLLLVSSGLQGLVLGCSVPPPGAQASPPPFPGSGWG